VEHTISVCTILAKEQYIKRHYRGCAELRFKIYKEIRIKLDIKHCYDHVTKSVETSHALWNQQVRTDGTIADNKLDIIIRDNEKATCMLIDVVMPGERNVIKKGAEKI
jgi:hypothetical protein